MFGSRSALLGVYTGSSLDELTEVGTGVSAPSGSCLSGVTKVRFDYAAGSTYYLAIDGEGGEEASFSLQIRNTSGNDDFANAQDLSGWVPQFASGSNFEATREAGEPEIAGDPGGASVWYSWTPSASQIVSVSVCGTGSFVPLLGVYTGSALEDLAEVGSSAAEGSGNCVSAEARVRFKAEAGTTYRIALDGQGGAESDFSIWLEGPPENDDFDAAEELQIGLESALWGDNFNASSQPQEPQHGGAPGGASVWYSWTADRSGPIRIGTCFASFSAELGVYTGDSLEGLEPVSATAANGCSAGDAGAIIDAVEGTTYRIAVDGVGGAEGSFLVDLFGPAENDAFADAEELSGVYDYAIGTNFHAGLEEGEPQHGGSGGASVWYRWTAPSDGRFQLRTCTASFDTLLAVYQGSSLGALEQVASNDDGSCNGGGLDPNGSALSFSAAAGSTYYFAVDGKAGAEGIFYLELSGPPDTYIVSHPAEASAETDPSFTYGSDRGYEVDHFECSLDEGPFVPCPPSSVSYSGLGEGGHTFAVRSVDLEGNPDPTPAVWSWSIDTTPPDTFLLESGPVGTVASDSAQFSFSGSPLEDVQGFECQLDGAGFQPCSGGVVSYSHLLDGSHTFSVRAVDAAGNYDPSPQSRSWSVDTTPPNTSLEAGPNGVVAETTAAFEFSGDPGADVAGYQCRIDGGPFEQCPEGEKSYSELADGPHNFQVRAVDAVGNVDPSPAARNWTVDTTPPVTEFGAGPADPTNSDEAKIEFEADEEATFECGIDGGDFAACASPLELFELTDGEHELLVRGTDAVGNVALVPARLTWKVDTVAPDTEVISAPEELSRDPSPSFAFASNETGGSFECSLDEGEFSSCTSPDRLYGLADGEHVFSVRARDTAGNVDSSPAISNWTVDTTPPDTEIESGPSGTIGQPSAHFTYVALPLADLDHFECRLDEAAFSTCDAEGIDLQGLTEGAHSFEARAVDAAGNPDPSPASRRFRVESRPPQTTITSGPSGRTADASPSFEFISDESESTFECSLDSAQFQTCDSPFALHDLADGEHQLEVRAVDSGDSPDPTPAVRTFTVDTTPPETTIESGPSGTVISSAAFFQFGVEPDGDFSHFECSLDGADFALCSAATEYHHLSEGAHQLSVRAVDIVGNADPVPAERAWTIDFSADTSPPQTSISSGPSGTTGASDAAFAFAADEQDSAFECSLDEASFETCESPRGYKELGEGTHSFAVRATDPAGNADPTPARREWAVDLTPPETRIESGPAEGETTPNRHPTFTYAGEPETDTSSFECQLDDHGFEACSVDGREFSHLGEGPHVFAVRAVDPYGNVDPTPATRSFIVPPNHAPEADLSVSAASGVAPLDEMIDVTAGDPDADPIEYSLSFGDGSAGAGGNTPPAAGFSHVYSHAGTFQVRLAVSDGDATTVRTATVVVDLSEPLRADAGDDQRAFVGEAVRFDAGASRPGAAIDRYEWDFGDGVGASGARPQHAYSAPGTYSVQLTAGSGPDTDTDSATVTVTEPPPARPGLVVNVSGGGAPLAGATALLVRPDGSRETATSDGTGKAHLSGAPDGSSTVYVSAPGFRPAAVTGTVEEEQGEVAADLEPGEPGATTLESKRLTYDEILAKGIDVADPENSHVYEARIHLFFVPDEEETPSHVIDVYVTPEGLYCVSPCSGAGGIGGGGGGGDWSLTTGFSVGGYSYVPRVTYVGGEPLIQWLVLPIRASFLKEFFEVKMIVENLTHGLTFSPGVAGLQLPAGLSLAPLAEEQSLQQQVGAIPSGQSATVSWVVRGDSEGEYDLSADYSASLPPLEESVYLQARTREPLKVWGASALKTRILVDEKAVRWGPYAFDVEITNVSDVPVYNMQVEMLDREADAPEENALFFYAPMPPQVQGTGRIEPKESWVAHYVVYPGLGNEEVTRLRVVLRESFVERTGGDVDLNPTLGIREGRSLGPDAGPVNVKVERNGSAEDEAVLSWLQPSAPDGLSVRGYQLWSRQRLDGGSWDPMWKVANKPEGMEGTTIPASDRAAGRYYAIGTEFSDGSVAFLHQLGVGPPRYVSLGDSFSSGEGVPEFSPGTAADVSPVPDSQKEKFPYDNHCHRSERGSYGRRLVADPAVTANLEPAVFAACSGAVTRDLETANPDNVGEPPQLEHLSQFTNLVTLTMGGNDIGFGDIAALCAGFDCDDVLKGYGVVGGSDWMNAAATMWSQGSYLYSRISEILGAGETCADPVDLPGKLRCLYEAHKAIKAIGEIIDHDLEREATPRNLYNGVLRSRLERIYKKIADQAPNAQVLVQLYPQIASSGSDHGLCTLYPGLPLSLSEGERTAIGTVVTNLNGEISAAVNSVNARLSGEGRPRQFEVVGADNFGGHELCQGGTLNQQSYFNSVVLPYITSNENQPVTYSFHPNAEGQRAFEREIAKRLNQEVQANVCTVLPQKTTDAGSAFVPYGGHSLHAVSSWPGSTVTMSLVSPAGEVYDADSPNVRSGSTATSEWLEVPDPEAGNWKVRLYGDDVDEEGETAQVSVYADLPAPQAPDIQVHSAPVAGEADTFDLSADGPGGTSFEWTFSDGGAAAGATVRHSFPAGEERWATVHAVASDGGEGWFPVDLGAPTIDQTLPVITGVPADQSIEAVGFFGAPVDYALPSAVDAVDGEVPVVCSPPPGTTFALGTTTVHCDATDSSGNSVSVSFDVLVQDVLPPDTTPPDTEIDSGPGEGEVIAGAAVDFTYSGSPGADVDHFECQIDGETFAVCPQAGVTYGPLADGAHSFAVRAVDAAGNADPSPATRAFTVSLPPPPRPQPPVLTGTSPASPADDQSPSVLGTASPGSSVRIYANASCAPPAAASGKADGSGAFSLAVAVPNGTTTSFTGEVETAAGTSDCSVPISYVELNKTPPPPGDPEGAPPAAGGSASGGSTPTPAPSAEEPAAKRAPASKASRKKCRKLKGKARKKCLKKTKHKKH
ncbi:MAG: PKD domain-containing protein [Methanosarcina sp.]